MNLWDKRFQNEDYIFGTEPNLFLKAIQKTLNLSGAALAIAEGEGRNAVFMAEQGMEVTTWDFSEVGLNKTQKLAESRGVKVETKLIDLVAAEWEKEKWDELVCIFGHFPSDIRNRTLAGIKEAVKPGGYFITEVYSTYQLQYGTGGPKEMDFLYTPDLFLQTFSEWRIQHFFMGEVTRHEGERHSGLCHVIQFVGQKP